MTALTFDPSKIQIKVGDKVQWKNDDSTLHTVMSGSCTDEPELARQFDSSLVDTVIHSPISLIHLGFLNIIAQYIPEQRFLRKTNRELSATFSVTIPN